MTPEQLTAYSSLTEFAVISYLDGTFRNAVKIEIGASFMSLSHKIFDVNGICCFLKLSIETVRENMNLEIVYFCTELFTMEHGKSEGTFWAKMHNFFIFAQILKFYHRQIFFTLSINNLSTKPSLKIKLIRNKFFIISLEISYILSTKRLLRIK